MFNFAPTLKASVPKKQKNRQFHCRANQKVGFTLVELVVSLTIFALLLGSMFYVFGVELRFWQRIVAKAEKQQISNMVMARLAADLRSAEDILAGSNSDQLFLKIGSDTLGYSLINGKVRRKKNGYSSYLTAEGDLAQLFFSYPAAGQVEVKLDGYTARLGLRN